MKGFKLSSNARKEYEFLKADPELIKVNIYADFNK